MHSLKQRLKRWFNANFKLIKEGQSSWAIESKSCLGCLLLLLLFLPLILISLGYTFFLLFKIYPIVFSTLIIRLGIDSSWALPLLIATFFGCLINLPLFVLTVCRHSEHQIKIEFIPFLLLKSWCLPSYQTQAYNVIFINLTGGLIPIILALYQFHRVQPLAILLVTALVALLSYFLVTIILGRAIGYSWLRFWLVTIVAALSAMLLVAGGVNRFDVPVAFAGGVLGVTIGGDLLHLKDVCSKTAPALLSIGGAGFDDGIAQCGLCAVIIAEWLPAAIDWLSAYFR